MRREESADQALPRSGATPDLGRRGREQRRVDRGEEPTYAFGSAVEAAAPHRVGGGGPFGREAQDQHRQFGVLDDRRPPESISGSIVAVMVFVPSTPPAW